MAPGAVPPPHRKLQYVVAILRGTLSPRAYAEVKTLVHDMFQNRMSDTTYTRDKGSTVQVRGYKIYWLQKELHKRFSRHFEGHSPQVRGADLLFVDGATQGPLRQRAQQGPSAPKPKSRVTLPPWRSQTSAPPESLACEFVYDGTLCFGIGFVGFGSDASAASSQARWPSEEEGSSVSDAESDLRLSLRDAPADPPLRVARRPDPSADDVGDDRREQVRVPFPHERPLKPPSL